MRNDVPVVLRLAIVWAAVEAAALVVYCIAIGIAAQNSRGSSVTATGWEIVIYLCFAALIGAICVGLMRRRSLARTPFLVTQVFVGIVGYTVFVGDGVVTKTVGAVILLIGVAGTVLAFTPALVEALTDDGGGESG